MSAARKTLKILALIYFVLGIASLVIGIAGIATGKLESTYGSNAMLAAVVLVAKGVIDLGAGVAGIKGANKPSQVDGAFKRLRGSNPDRTNWCTTLSGRLPSGGDSYWLSLPRQISISVLLHPA